MLAVNLVLLTTIPPFAIVSVPVPKLPMLSPPLESVDPTGARAGHRHRTRRAGGQSDGAAPAMSIVPPSWMVSVPVPNPPTTMPPAFDQLAPAPVTVTVPTPPGRSPTVPNELAKVPPFWIVSVPVPF